MIEWNVYRGYYDDDLMMSGIFMDPNMSLLQAQERIDMYIRAERLNFEQELRVQVKFRNLTGWKLPVPEGAKTGRAAMDQYIKEAILKGMNFKNAHQWQEVITGGSGLARSTVGFAIERALIERKKELELAYAERAAKLGQPTELPY